MPHLTLFVFIATLAAGAAGIALFAQLWQRYAFRFLRSGVLQLALFNAIVALNVAYMYYSVNLAGDSPSLWVETAYHAVSPVLKVAWVALLWAMVRDLLDRRAGRTLRRSGWTVLAVLLVAELALAGHALTARTVEIVGTIHFGLELPVIVAAWAVVVYLVARSGSITEESRRRPVRELGLAILVIWTLATSIFLGGILFDVPGEEARLLFSSVLLFAYNLVPVFVLRKRLGGMVERPAAGVAGDAPDREDLAEAYGISPREREIVELICRGKRNQEIADELFISLQTVKDHNYRIYRKLGVRNRVQLVNKVRGER
jgi:DNA-binding CsgD family transcriptional regulator